MTRAEKMVSIDDLRSQLSYDKDSGELSWKESRRGCASGKIAGSDRIDGYRRVMFRRLELQSHRVVWALCYGKFPEGEIDHINHIRNDNRIENLRDVTVTENKRNRTLAKNNASGITGVHFCNTKNRWVAWIHVKRKRILLGHFSSLFDAACARKSAEVSFGYHKNHGGRRGNE